MVCFAGHVETFVSLEGIKEVKDAQAAGMDRHSRGGGRGRLHDRLGCHSRYAVIGPDAGPVTVTPDSPHSTGPALFRPRA